MQLALARGLAETTAGTNVTVNSVLPGPTRSEGVEQFIRHMAKSRNIAAVVEQEFFERVRLSSLLKRFATANEVAAFDAFLAARCPQRRLAHRFGWTAESFGPSYENCERHRATVENEKGTWLDPRSYCS